MIFPFFLIVIEVQSDGVDGISNRLDVVLAQNLILQGLLTCNPRIGSYQNYMFSLEILYAVIDVEI